MPGPIIIDLLGETLTPEEENLLQHPLVGGVILFSRNFSTAAVLADLCRTIRNFNSGLIVVDQEGGRVQRFISDFTRLPSMGSIGKLYERMPARGITLAYHSGWLMAAELLSVGIDLSFAPVLDLAKIQNPAIGDRAFHADPKIVVTLASALIRGMQDAGMAATGKHFPGHGSVHQDSHETLPTDSRALNTILAEDAEPFKQLIAAGMQGIMSAHIVFTNVDAHPVNFSEKWLQTILRKQYQFAGMIFSDDLNMKATHVLGDPPIRAALALKAGCDMILICNNRPAAINILDKIPRSQVALNKLAKLRGQFSYSFSQLKTSKHWQEKNVIFNRLLDKEI
jgi:beta-N-acetylhexosaminidase